MIIYLSDIQCQHSLMNNAERRWLNARWLATMAGGAKQFGEKIGMEAAQVSHIIGEKPKRGIGNTLAPRIEQKFGKEPGWLDQDHLGAVTKIGAVRRFAEMYEKGDLEFRGTLETMLDIYEAARAHPDRRQEERPRIPNRRAK